MISTINYKEKGFTLVELLVVTSIISFLSSIVLASLNTSREKARINAAREFNASLLHSYSSIGYWNFEDNTQNQVGKDFNLSISDPSIVYSSDTPIGVGKSLSFPTSINSSSASVRASPSPTFTIQGNFVLSAWIKTNANEHRRIIDVGHCGFSNGYIMQLTNTSPTGAELVGGIGAGSMANSLYFHTDGSNLSDNKWHHVAAIFDQINKKAYLYVDGAKKPIVKWSGTCGTVSASANDELDFSACSSLVPGYPSYMLEIGGGCAENFKGFIDDPMILYDVLSS